MVPSAFLRSTFFRRSLAIFLPLAGLLTIAAFLVYGAVQHVYRTSANDPQMQIATDDVLSLNAGASPRRIASGLAVDLARSLAVHTTVFDRGDRVLASTARLDGAVPTPPNRVMDDVMRNGSHWLSWQPRPGVRVAAVVMPWRGGTVLVGRSLAPIEDRETSLLQFCRAAWLAGMGALAVAALVASRLWPALLPVGDQLAVR
jgi:hypothetical protein